MYILPQPKEIERQEGIYRLSYQDSIVFDEESTQQLVELSGCLQKEIEDTTGFLLPIKRGKKKKQGIWLLVSPEHKEQSYRLKITSEGIEISGGDINGVRYGIQTLRQILRQTGPWLPFLVIRDEPSLLNRGFFHDVTRGRVPTLAYLKRLADRLAFYKINQLQLYIEHSFLFEDFSEVWRDDTPLTGEEIMELDAYCTGLGIELIPSLSCFGHLYKVLSTKSYCHLCELEGAEKEPFSFLARMQHHTIDVSNPESHIFIKKMIEEFLPFFSSKQFNLCGDETFDLGKGRGRELAEQIGQDRMYINFVKELCEFLIEKGKRPMFWGDIICKFPEAVKELPKETICLNWGYLPEQREEETKKLWEAGATQYTCPGVCGWNQLVNLVRDSYENIKRMCHYAEKYQCLGVLNTDWGDFGHINHPEFGRMGLIYGAAFSWNTDIPEFEEINRQISRLEFGDSRETIVSTIADLAECSSFGWELAVKYREAVIFDKSEEERKACLPEDKLLKAEENNNRLKELTDQFCQSLPYLQKESRRDVWPYFVAIEGMELWNRIGVALWKREREEPEETKELAKALEVWFYHYKKMWRMISGESELYRIQEVVYWYADILR
ncbi:glycoside hydrolase family 20 zincin-like fold domain-containing protein [Acetivibrio ethanolgignens]|uniref:beta-N-acetylhexosaminidase n=1 Tax=Acetivibrio ethanolgignens TaxID=290052 RepID=A0A0V8QJH8_9FIRM|nr:glycoside hydrolase family 20 zincin-like fold domain-containing protein [Acetivibrio ethanolgignens]KSV60638.1 hypothetical protein ASU35_00225 [Acetivibrio ethanolgignens]